MHSRQRRSKQFLRGVAIAGFALLVPALASAQGSPFDACVALGDDVARLACYDAAAGRSIQAREWVQLASFNGNGTLDTESFDAPGEWRVRWEVPAGAEGLLQVYIYDGTGNLVDLVANQTTPAPGSSIVRAPAGRFYFGVISFGHDWQVIAERRP